MVSQTSKQLCLVVDIAHQTPFFEYLKHHQGAFLHTALHAAASTNQSTLASVMCYELSFVLPHSHVEVLTPSTSEGNRSWRQK